MKPDGKVTGYDTLFCAQKTHYTFLHAPPLEHPSISTPLDIRCQDLYVRSLGMSSVGIFNKLPPINAVPDDVLVGQMLSIAHIRCAHSVHWRVKEHAVRLYIIYVWF